MLPAGCTTLVLRNLPSACTQRVLVQQFQVCGYTHDIDLVFLPLNLESKGHLGYAFVNFRTEEACRTFAWEFHLTRYCDKLLTIVKSAKVCQITSAHVQSSQELLRRMRSYPALGEMATRRGCNKEALPCVMDEEGVETPLCLGQS
jgi:hypothetical protein